MTQNPETIPEEEQKGAVEGAPTIVTGYTHSTVCDHDWQEVGQENGLIQMQCRKCWSGIQTERKNG